jgi:Universal stress protein UspA and related nucleotide-binding proteins
MNAPFKNIALAVSFSPTSKKLLIEARHLKELFDAKLSVIHIGSNNPENQLKLYELLLSSGLKDDDVEVLWNVGDPKKVIIETCKEKNIDLLIAGALEEEKFLNYYLGTVARTLMRDAPCSVLFISASENFPKKFDKFCISVDFSLRGENTLKKAYEWAKLEKLDSMTLIREIQVPGLAMTVNDSGSLDDITEAKTKWEKDEIDKMDLFIKELNLTEIDYRFICLYGKQGWESKNYVYKNYADLFVISAPPKRLSFFDRIFPSGLEYIARQLPCSLLIVKPNGNINNS